MTDLGIASHRWRAKHLSESNANVPTLAGVYVIGHQDTPHGLAMNRVYVYVGETKNLQRRLNEHLPDTEENPRLRAYLRKRYAHVMCWYLPVDDDQTQEIQNDLIREIKPLFNTIGL